MEHILQNSSIIVSCACSIIFCEAVAIYGVIVAIILQTKIESVNQLANGLWPTSAYTAGYAILGSGLTTGWANLACG
jgi:V-type H+-transporting ATPase proteolipid subunit